MIYKNDLPVASAAKFSVPSTALDDGTAAYGTVVSAGSGRWVAGNAFAAGRKFLVVVQTHGALTGAPTAMKVGLYKGSDANGTGVALVAGTDTEWLTPAANTTYTAEIDCAKLTNSASDFYSLGLSLNGAGTTAVTASATALVMDPGFVA